jgi:hypothetical protein
MLISTERVIVSISISWVIVALGVECICGSELFSCQIWCTLLNDSIVILTLNTEES